MRGVRYFWRCGLLRPKFQQFDLLRNNSYYSPKRWYCSEENDADKEFLDLLYAQGIKLEDIQEVNETIDTEEEEETESDQIIELSEEEFLKKSKEEQLALIESEDDDVETAFEYAMKKLEKEGEVSVPLNEVKSNISDFCPTILRKWVEDAVGALTGKGFYNSEGQWIEYTKIDGYDSEQLEKLTTLPPLPPLTFRVTKMPGGQEGFAKRAYNPPMERTKLPEDLQGQYRFDLPKDLVENLDLSPKLKKALSFAYATNKEIRGFRMKKNIEKWGKTSNDCGNTAVQLCVITEKIRYLTEHLKTHKKDHCARRRLRIIQANRRNLFKYLKRRDVTLYYELLKDQVVEDKFLMHGNE